MLKKNLGEFNRRADHISDATNKFFGQQVPDYIKTLPSIKKDSIRWAANILYFGVGLMFYWAVSAVLRRMPNMEQFPANVAGMIVLYFLLMCARTVLPKQTDNLVKFIDPYSSFALRSMNVMFVPPVVLIVNNPPTAGPEVGRMICVFLVGYFVGFTTCTLIVRFWKMVLYGTCNRHKQAPHLPTSEKVKMHKNKTLEEEEVHIAIPPGPTDLSKFNSTVSAPGVVHQVSNGAISCASTLPGGSIASAPEHEEPDHSTDNNRVVYERYKPRQKHGPLHVFALWCMDQSTFDDLTMFIIFCICAFVFLPLPADSPALPFFRLFLYLTMTLLLYSASCRLPAKVRLVVHPIILTAACVMAGIAYFEQVKGSNIHHGADLYKNGVSFVSLVEKTNVAWPGAGDILSATMDVSIISMAFNVYKCRPDSFREWMIVCFSVAPMAFLVMFVTPLFAHGIGCTPADSIVWSSRSVTTAIGMVIGNILGANQSVVTCIIVFTGIMGPLVGPTLLKLARVKDDDFMTIGITMGSNSHGVGTAYLISKNPKASGLASIAFALFGTIGVIVASIPALSQTVKHLGGY
ncbi:hypothetical protein INT47_010763 [Mucor saturninus]|uniref:Uncharacterized protein n=1 Tax=Mucor saturninus TaxID=64648 RepID=A0A8H7R1T2_9FUNG|nr:hypothetical protein INT47_010763 [Mucor saturninus]